LIKDFLNSAVGQIDIEQAFANHEDVMEVLEHAITQVLTEVSRRNKAELESLERNLVVPSLPIRRVAYSEAVEVLKAKNEDIIWGHDFSKSQEKVLNDVFGEMFFVIDWPTEARAFFSMPSEKDPRFCNAFDLVYDGLEICSGAQRINIPALLEQRIAAKGLNPEDFKTYIDAFRYGAPIHSGWSIGLERLTAKVCGLKNIRQATMFPRDRNRLTP
jgi:aspartyl-tRNA synthetase